MKTHAITKIDRAACRTISDTALKALQAVAAQHGLTVKAAGGRYEDTRYTARFAFTVNDAQVLETSAKEKWDKWCELLGLKPEDFGKTFTVKGKTYRITGLLPNRDKNSIQLDCAGQAKVCSAASIKQFLKS